MTDAALQTVINGITQIPPYELTNSDRTLPPDYYKDLQKFLEEVDYINDGPPKWVCDYYLSNYEQDVRLYNKWQNTQYQPDGIEYDGIQYDGDQHLMEYEGHLSRCDMTHCNLVAGSESYPSQEPFYYGPPAHTNYTQVEIPIYRLPTDRNGIYGADEIVAIIIGKDGYNLKQLTTSSGLHYIWHNRELGVFELWGRPDRLANAVARLVYKINTSINILCDRYHYGYK